MKKMITKVTVTGADDSVLPQDLIKIAEESPFVEFGILLSRNAMGGPRFPSRDWLHEMVAECMGRRINFSGHICGSWVREILQGNWPTEELEAIHNRFMSRNMFQRFQINTHAQPHEVDYSSLPDMLVELEDQGKTVIFQLDNVNNGLLAYTSNVGIRNVAGLFDLSHGAGILPSEWPKPFEYFPCGYAGGLSPENVAGQITRLEPIVGNQRIWIDAETKLRSADNAQFDLDKVRAFLEAARPWVIE